MVRLGEVATPVQRALPVVPGKPYRTLGVRWWGEGAYERHTIDGSETAARTLNEVREGDLIINKIWVRHGSVAIVGPQVAGCAGSNEFPTFELNPQRVIPRWVDWYTRTRDLWQKCDALSQGTSGKNRIRPERFLSIEIPLPPLPEQRRIVAKIDRLAEKIEEARGVRERSAVELDTSAASTVQGIFDGAHDPCWTKGDLGDYVVDVRYGTSDKTNDDATGTPILRMGNIQNGSLDTKDLKYLHLSSRDRERLHLEGGDVLVNRTNSAELVGKCAVFDREGDWGFASYIIRIRLDQKRADPILVARYINSPIGRQYMFRERKQMTGQANVNSKKLKALPISLPPLPEQRRIVTYLDDLQAKVDAIKALQAKTAAELDALLPSILDKAFKGEL